MIGTFVWTVSAAQSKIVRMMVSDVGQKVKENARKVGSSGAYWAFIGR